jgi:hypothetical protein
MQRARGAAITRPAFLLFGSSPRRVPHDHVFPFRTPSRSPREGNLAFGDQARVYLPKEVGRGVAPLSRCVVLCRGKSPSFPGKPGLLLSRPLALHSIAPDGE